MSDGLAQRARRLREAFDRSFSESLERAARPATTDFLGLRVGGEPYAVPLLEVGALHVDRLLAPLPSPDRLVCGLVSLRGVLHTVLDLRAMLGKSTALPPRWLITLKGAPAAYAFDGFDGLLRVESASVVAAVTADKRVNQMLLGPPRRPVLNLITKGP